MNYEYSSGVDTRDLAYVFIRDIDKLSCYGYKYIVKVIYKLCDLGVTTHYICLPEIRYLQNIYLKKYDDSVELDLSFMKYLKPDSLLLFKLLIFAFKSKKIRMPKYLVLKIFNSQYSKDIELELDMEPMEP